MSDTETSANSAAFVTTRWTRVLQARGESPEARAALSELCEAYYAPVLAFIRHVHRDPESARDLTQTFFARLLAGGALDMVERGRGRFRSYLLGAVKHFLAVEHRRSQAARRGGGQIPMSLQTGGPGGETTTELQVPDPIGPLPDTLFDRHWATALVDRSVAALAQENATAGKSEQFAVLKPWLLGEIPSLSQAETAQQLGMSEGALKVAVHRLRKRFREWVRAEIAQTVDDPSQIQDELRYLVEVLAQPETDDGQGNCSP